ncbi:MAG: SDR family oxidoreductase [Kordiimonas sp.]
MGLLKGKVAIITGASSGIGYETAKLFAAEGASVVLGARRQEKLDMLVSEIEAVGGAAIGQAGDVRDEAYAKHLVDSAMVAFGQLDVAFNNAGTLGALGPVADMRAEDWLETIDTNLTSAFYSSKYQIPAMNECGAGSLIFTSSFVGYSNGGMPGMAAYAASKAGLIGLTQALASEYGSAGVRVNALLPGGTDTAMAPQDADSRHYVSNIHALKRIAKPHEIAKSALYLASDLSSFTTGHALLSDGGVSAHFA